MMMMYDDDDDMMPPCVVHYSVFTKFSVKWLHRGIFVLVTSLCLADIVFDVVLMTSAYSQYLKELL